MRANMHVTQIGICKLTVGGTAIPNLSREPIRSIGIVSNFGVWRETAKDGAHVEPVQEETRQRRNNTMIEHKAWAFL